MNRDKVDSIIDDLMRIAALFVLPVLIIVIVVLLFKATNDIDKKSSKETKTEYIYVPIIID